MPHEDGTIALHGGPSLNLGLGRDLSLRVRDLGALACLTIKLPAVEWTLNAGAIDLYRGIWSKNVNHNPQIYMYKKW